MKSFFCYYIQTFKNIVANTSVFTTLIAAIILYSFFYPTAYKAQSAEDITIVVGGVIPQQDYEFLYQNGAHHIFGPGTNLPKSACEILEKMLA